MDSGSPVHTGRTILTALYLCMLGVCFLVPIFFYFRMHCDERRNRHLRDIEIAGMTQAMNESQLQQREESRAARRKYREERKARINQLFSPVRMILTEDNFIHPETHDKNGTTTDRADGEMDVEAPQQSCKSQDESQEETSGDMQGSCGENYEADEFILVPKPGLPHGAAIYEFNSNTNSFLIANNQSKSNQRHEDDELRKVPNECSICLCEYTPGSDIVWSSNPQCEHVFHTNCIEQWLMKQRDGPLCPCCRRDFVIDPFDLGPGETDDLEKGGTNVFARSSDGMMNSSASTGRRSRETGSIADDVNERVLAMFLAQSLANSVVRIDESDGSTVDAPAQLAPDDSNTNTS